MTLAFILASVIAGILFFLWLSGRDRLNESEAKIRQLTSQVETQQVRTMSTVSTSQTRLTPELVNDVIRNNGFIPLPSNDSEWIHFKWQGEVFVNLWHYSNCYHSVVNIQNPADSLCVIYSFYL